MHDHCCALTHNPSFLNLPCVVGCSKEDFRCDEHTWPLQHCNAADWKENSTRQVHLLGRRSHHSASHGTSNICIPIVDAGSLTALCESFSILPSVYLILQLFHPCPTCDFCNTVECILYGTLIFNKTIGIHVNNVSQSLSTVCIHSHCCGLVHCVWSCHSATHELIKCFITACLATEHVRCLYRVCSW